jgi:hypothetical protein
MPGRNVFLFLSTSSASGYATATMLHTRSTRRKHTQILLVSLCILFGLWWLTSDPWNPTSINDNEHLTRHGVKTHRPLDDVITEAQNAHEARISHRVTSLHGAVYAYRQRRRRHPPPGFEKWYARALASKAVIVESFFDQIYEDLEPFWGLEPASLRGALSEWEWTLRIRDGRIRDIPQGRFRSRVWGEMINKVAGDLPDMDIAINPLDEPRLFVPFTKVDALVKAASQHRDRMMSLPVNKILGRPSAWISAATVDVFKPEWIKEGQLWPYVLETCQPAKDEPITGDDETILTHAVNWTTTKNICANHHWADLHGSLIKPATMEISTDLLPIFSTAKLQGSNDILLPPPAYYTNDVLFTGKGWFGDGKISTSWHKKLHGLVWRGKATGGIIHGSTVEKSHRQRLVSMLNASNVPSILTDNSSSWSSSAEFSESDHIALASWLKTTADAAFTDTMCPVKAKDPSEACVSMAQHFQTAAALPMKKQYHYKYLPDIDGNSLSGRFRAFLTSNTCTLKATIFKEWHDHRLMPWVHFVPLDITLRDLWATMAYFLGFAESHAHDVEGERIAEEGRLWADKVLRKEDMELYMHRVLLEYGRICDDDRDRLGFTDDLKAG